MASPPTSLVWADGAVTEGSEISTQLEVDLGRLLGISPAVYLNGRDHLEGQVDLLGDCAKTLGYTQFEAAKIVEELVTLIESTGFGHLVVSLLPGPASHKAAPPGSDWFLNVEQFSIDQFSVENFSVGPQASRLRVGLSNSVRNHHGVCANLLLLDDLELDLAPRDGVDVVLWLNGDGNVACADQSAVIVREGSSSYTPPLTDGAIESGWRGRAVGSGEVVESSISLARLLAADEVYCLMPWGQRIQVASVEGVGVSANGGVAGDPGAVR